MCNYTVHSNEHIERDARVPSVMFKYDLSPMTVEVSKQSVPFYHFITSVCAIIGGVFTVIGLVDSALFNTIQVLSPKRGSGLG